MSTRSNLLALALCSATLFAVSCGESKSTDETTTTEDTIALEDQPGQGITLSDVSGAQEFADAQLSIANVTAEKQGSDSAKVTFNFDVKNYELKSQTNDSTSKQCNNSAQGQHIHFIKDNEPYVALYDPKYTTTVALNSEHYVLVFLSRSYHLSLKNKGAAMVYHFKVDGNGKLQKMDDPKTPMVFYSRPKGDYLGKDTENVLFDYYLWNAGDGQKVNAKISSGGQEKTADMAEWKPQFLHGLAMGKNSITLTLMDKDGKVVEGPMTTVTREFNLAADEPMK